jgi:hypothetical protein
MLDPKVNDERRSQRMKDWDSFVELCDDADLNLSSYSGRFMYGGRCVSVSGGDPAGIMLALFQALLEQMDVEAEWSLEAEFADRMLALMKRYRVDSLGKGVVVYWPDVEWQSKWTEQYGGEAEDGEDE